MALIRCPDCGGNVSDKAKACIHCGAPLVAEKNIVKIKLPRDKDCIVRLNYTISDDNMQRTLASGNQGDILTFELNHATTLRCHLGRGFKDATANYTPGGTKRYAVQSVNTFFGAHLTMSEVDVFDSDN